MHTAVILRPRGGVTLPSAVSGLLSWNRGDTGLKTGGARDYNGTNQYHSHADNAFFSATGDVYIAVHVRLDDAVTAPNEGVFAKYSGSQRSYALFLDDSPNQARFLVSETGSGSDVVVNASSFGTLPIGEWMFIECYHDATNDLIGICVNNGTWDTAAHSTGIFDGTSEVRLASLETSRWMNGRLSRVLFAKESAARTILDSTALQDDLYNNGNGRTSQYVNDNIVTLDGTTADFWALNEASGNALSYSGSNDLTDNSSVGSADGPSSESPVGNGDPIVGWESKEGQSYQFQQTTAAKRPAAALNASGINGKPAVEFDGTELLVLSSAPLQDKSDLTLILPFETGSTAFSADQVILASSDEATATSYLCAGIDSAGKCFIEVNDAGTTYRATGDTVLSTSTVYLLTLRDSGSAWGMDVNGAAQTLTESGSYKGISDLTGLDNTTLGALKHTSEVDHFEGKLPEEILYSPTIADSDETNVEAYATSRYAIA